MRTLLFFSSAATLALLSMISASSAAERVGAHGGLLMRARSAVTKSHNFAGYLYQVSDHASFDVTSEMVVPKLKCTKRPERAIDPSVGVRSNKGVSLAGLFVGCQMGKAADFPNLEVNGSSHNYSKLHAKSGDTVLLRVTESGSGTSVSVVDETHKFKKTLKGAGDHKLSGPWVGDVGWYSPGLLGVPDFGALHFSKSQLDGTAFAAWGATTGSGATLIREDRTWHGTTKIATSAFASDQESFTTTYKRS